MDDTDLTYTFPSEDGREDPDPDRREPRRPYADAEWDTVPAAVEVTDDGPSTWEERYTDAGYDSSDPKRFSIQ